MLSRLALAALASVLICTAQDFTDLQIEQIGKGFHFAEGPVWSREGYLVFSDVPTNRILHLAPPATERDLSRVAVFREESGGASGSAFDAHGRFYTCETHARRVTRTDKKGKIEVLADTWQGKRLNSPNDLVVRHDEHLYFTDPAFGSAVETRELDFYGVFHVTPKGELSLVGKWQTRPNGIALSPNGKLLYVADSDRHQVRVYDLDGAGNASNERVFLSGIAGVPNGLCTDEEGNLYVAANSVVLFDPRGKPLGEIPIGETPSNCAFGDADFDTLYITARSGIYRTRLKVKGSVQY